MIPPKSVCDACRSGDIYTVYHLPRIPVFQNRLLPSRAEALKVDAAEVILAACSRCGLVFNSAFDNAKMNFNSDYQAAQDRSAVFQSHLEEVIATIMHRLKPQDRVIEIGCGKGHFLSLLKDRGVNITGFDPTYEGNAPYIVKDYFTEKSAPGVQAEALILRHTLQHIEAPYDFLIKIKSRFPADTKIFIEVPRFEWIAQHNAFWDIFHEQCNYLTEAFIKTIFADRVDIHRCFSDQYMLIAARLGDFVTEIKPRPQTAYHDVFSATIPQYKSTLQQSERNYVWGAGAKGVSFVNVLDPEAKRIEAVVDINPGKQGKFLPLTGHACIAPEAIDWRSLTEKDCLWIMNSNYKDEILESLSNPACKVATLGDS